VCHTELIGVSSTVTDSERKPNPCFEQKNTDRTDSLIGNMEKNDETDELSWPVQKITPEKSAVS